MNLRQTNLIIDNENQKSIGDINYKKVKLTRNSKEGIDFGEISDLGKNFGSTGKIKIILETSSGQEELEVPDKILEKLGEYIRDRAYLHYQSRNNFDCFDFSHYLNGIYYEQKGFDYTNWNISEDLEGINPGDTILMCNVLKGGNKSVFKIGHNEYIADRLFHFAVYLGNGLYISKLGKGDIYVTNLEEMKKLYDYENILKLKPKSIEEIRSDFKERILIAA